MGIIWGDASTRSEEAVVIRIISKTVGLIASDFAASPVLAFKPGDLQRDIAFIDAVLKCPSAKSTTGSGEDMNGLINASLCFGGKKYTSAITSIDMIINIS